ncbi:MAG: DNA adenine methylase, partial [Gammaproteobacteria bacterium]
RLASVWVRNRKRRLVEPFCGGLAVALGLDPARALLNDINPHTVNFYRHLQNGLTIRERMRNDEALYYRHREAFNWLIAKRRGHTARAASLFYYLNRTGYNGLCRFNASGEFNVPFGRYKTINYTRNFSPYCETLSKWQFECMDFERLKLSRGDFVYADPPYDVQFTDYSSGGFGWSEQERLAHWLAQHKGPVVASNQATARILKLYRSLGFDIVKVDAPRSIACNGDRQRAVEMLAFLNVKPGPRSRSAR